MFKWIRNIFEIIKEREAREVKSKTNKEGEDKSSLKDAAKKKRIVHKKVSTSSEKESSQLNADGKRSKVNNDEVKEDGFSVTSKKENKKKRVIKKNKIENRNSPGLTKGIHDENFVKEVKESEFPTLAHHKLNVEKKPQIRKRRTAKKHLHLTKKQSHLSDIAHAKNNKKFKVRANKSSSIK